jgi:N-acetylmuramoyl-L-alanine amidase
MRYFYERPPEDTLIAWQKANNIAPDMGTTAGGIHVVERGDSLSEIAQQHGLSYSQLKLANGLENDVIHVGQELIIPGAGGMPGPLVTEHKAVRGDTLSAIAERYRVSLSSLRSANNLRNDVIQAGQVLKIPAQ